MDCDSVCGSPYAIGLARTQPANGAEDDAMDVAFAWIHHYDYLAIVVLLMLGIVGLPIPDEPC
jgi:hypothetical protein